MNATRAVSFVAAAAFAAQLLFPPWVRTYQRNGISQVRTPYDHVFIGKPPWSEGTGVGFEVDVMRLVLQLVATAALTGLGRAVALSIDRKADATPGGGAVPPRLNHVSGSNDSADATEPAGGPDNDPSFVHVAHFAAISLYTRLATKFAKVREFDPGTFDAFMTSATACRALQYRQRARSEDEYRANLAEAVEVLRDLFGERGPEALYDCDRFTRRRMKTVPRGVSRVQAVTAAFGLWVVWNLLGEKPGEGDDELISAIGLMTGVIAAAAEAKEEQAR